MLTDLKMEEIVMKKFLNTKIIVGIVVITFFLLPSVFAFNLTGKRWQNSQANMQVRTSGGPVYSTVAVQDGMDQWTDVETSRFVFNKVGTAATSTIGYDGVNKIAFGVIDDAETLGYSYLWGSGSLMIESDIQMRSNYAWSQSGLTTAITHELGHTLGLDHSAVEDAVMYYALDGQTVLHQDDINGVSYLYPIIYAFKGLGNLDDDLSGTGTSDVLWVERDTGKVQVWLMDGLTDSRTLAFRGDTAVIDDVDRSAWDIITRGDYNGDGKNDALLLHRTTGAVVVWLLDGTTSVSDLQARGDTVILNSTKARDWRLDGIGDFNGDGRDDLLWVHRYSGKAAVWLLDGTTPLADLTARGDTGILDNTVGTSLRVGGIGDFDNDGRDDILWYRPNTGAVSVWLLDGITPKATLSARGDTAVIHPNLALYYYIQGIADFDGDGRDDIVWRKKTGEVIVVWLLDGVTSVATLGSRGDTGKIHSTLDPFFRIKGIADFDGDGRDDILLGHNKTGQLVIWLMDGVTNAQTLTARGDTGIIHPGLSPTEMQLLGLGDFDADGKTDLLWQNSTTASISAWLLDGVTPWQTLSARSDTGVLACKMAANVKD
jgi:hypothetical protein